MEDKEETLMFRDDSATLASYGCGGCPDLSCLAAAAEVVAEVVAGNVVY